MADARSDDLLVWEPVITRAFPLTDIDLQSGQITCERCGKDATGRMVDAYAAVFGVPTEVYDSQGHYLEEIDRAAFNRAISHGAGNGFKNISVFYNHGKTLYDTPSERGSFSLGHPAAIRADGKGLLTSTHYGRHEIADTVLTQIMAGDISGHSFTGRTIRSNPDKIPRVHRGGDLLRVQRLELGLQEYGPTPIPYYTDTHVLAVRSATVVDQHSDNGPAGDSSQAGDSPHGTQGGQEEIAERIRKAREERGF